MITFIWNLLFYNLIIITLRNGYRRYGSSPLNNKKYLWLLILFVVFGIWGLQYGDFSHYSEIVENIYARSGDSFDISGMWLSHMEPLYNYLAIFFKGDHILWRASWQIVEFAGLFYLFKKLNMNNFETLYIMSLFVLQSICAGRVSWGVVYFWLGLYLFLETKEKKYLIFIAVSWFAHTSMILLFAMLPLVFIKPSKKLIILTIASMPLIVYGYEYLLGNYNMLDTEDELLQYKLDNYTEGARSEVTNPFGSSGMAYIAYVLHKPALYLSIFMFLRAFFTQKIVLSDSNKRFMTLWGAVFVFTVAAFFSGMGSASYYQRYTMMLYLPTFLLTYKAANNEFRSSQVYKFCLFLLWLSFNFEYIKSMYYFNIHGV